MNIRHIFWNGLINCPQQLYLQAFILSCYTQQPPRENPWSFRSSSVGESTWLMATSWIVQHRCFMSFGGDPKNNPPQNWDVSKGSWSKSGELLICFVRCWWYGKLTSIAMFATWVLTWIGGSKVHFWVVSSYKNASFLAFFTFSRSLKHPHAYQDIKVHTYIQNASMNLLTWWSLILQKKLHLVFNFFLKFVDTCLYWF